MARWYWRVLFLRCTAFDLAAHAPATLWAAARDAIALDLGVDLLDPFVRHPGLLAKRLDLVERCLEVVGAEIEQRRARRDLVAVVVESACDGSQPKGEG